MKSLTQYCEKTSNPFFCVEFVHVATGLSGRLKPTRLLFRFLKTFHLSSERLLGGSPKSCSPTLLSCEFLGSPDPRHGSKCEFHPCFPNDSHDEDHLQMTIRREVKDLLAHIRVFRAKEAFQVRG